MGLLLILLVGVYLVRTAAVDTTAMATGRTPPSHAYRMAKLQADKSLAEKAMADPSKAAAAKSSAPDLRGGAKMVARHWYLDACEDVDEWRANRRLSRPERKARKAERKARRQALIEKFRNRKNPESGPDGDGPGGQEEDQAAKPVVVEPPPPVPELPDNVIPLRGRDQRAAEETEPEVPQPPKQQEEKPVSTPNATAPDTATDAAGLNPHIAALNSAADYLAQLNTMLERIQGQMDQADMGAEVTGELGSARDANTAASAAMRRAAEVTEQVNRKVQEAYNASQNQAANKEYQQQGQ